MNNQQVKSYKLQVCSTKKRLWVHCSDGSTVARFSVRAGIDIHCSVSEQMEGQPECINCTHHPPTIEEWTQFQSYALEHWGLDIPENTLDFTPSKYIQAIQAAFADEQIEFTVEDFYK